LNPNPKLLPLKVSERLHPKRPAAALYPEPSCNLMAASPTTGRRQGDVSLVELKDLARTALPPSSPLRQLVLLEPDLVPADEIAVRVKMYSRLLYREIKATAAPQEPIPPRT